MLKFTGAIGSTLAALVVVPAAAFQDGSMPNAADGELTAIEAALENTVQALEVLAGLRAAETPAPIDVVRQVTEAPVPAGPERDERLHALRTELSLLQEELDVIEARIAAGRVEPALTEPVLHPEAPAPGKITTGLDADALAKLGQLPPPPKPAPKTEPMVPDSPEHPGYTANALLQAQACYRGGLYERGAQLLATDTTPAGLYWRGRCLEKLGRLAEAARVYETILAQEDPGTWGTRAQTNLEFVRWREGFEKRLPERKGSDS